MRKLAGRICWSPQILLLAETCCGHIPRSRIGIFTHATITKSCVWTLQKSRRPAFPEQEFICANTPAGGHPRHTPDRLLAEAPEQYFDRPLAARRLCRNKCPTPDQRDRRLQSQSRGSRRGSYARL